MESTATQMPNAEIGFVFFALGLFALWMARLRENGTISHKMARFIQFFAPELPEVVDPPEEWSKPEPPRRSKWLFMLSWWDKIPDQSRRPVFTAGIFFAAAIGFWIAALVTGR